LWQKLNVPSEAKLQEMSANLANLRYQPLISLLMPVNPQIKIDWLTDAVNSVLKQVYGNWQLFFIPTGNLSTELTDKLDQFMTSHPLIKSVETASDLATGLNSGLSTAHGDFLGIINPHDQLAPQALYEVVVLLNRYPEADFIYGDEDQINTDGTYTQPYFKPDWCPDSFLSRMYTGHLSLYRRTLLADLQGFHSDFAGSEEYDLVLRLTEKTSKIYHIPQILYHSRSPLATNSATAKQAITAALNRRGEPGQVQDVAEHPNFYRVRYQIKEPKLVSIIIPTKNLGDVLDRCLTSVFHQTTYPNYEVIVIDNGSDDPETMAIFQKWQNQEPQKFHCYRYDIPFNFSKINNYGVEKAKGDYLLFLNNDTEIITPDWLTAMVEQVQRPSIGAVGALLLYPDNVIQHAGVVMGLRSVADHSHRGFTPDEAGYYGQLISVNNYSAVTAACLMCRREIFDNIGGFDEGFAVAFNDVDLCLKMIYQGYYNIYLPHVQVYHHESKSRGVENTGEKQRRFQKEIQDTKRRWQKIIEVDPCYNPNLTKNQDDFSLRIQTDVEVSINMLEKTDDVVAVSVDYPQIGLHKNLYSLSIGGWLVLKEANLSTVQFVVDGQVLREVPANLPRQDVGQSHSKYPHAQHCGFWGEIEIAEFAPAEKIWLEAVLRDGSHIQIATVKLSCPQLLDD
jgi:GT2 family glycosyltransferase